MLSEPCVIFLKKIADSIGLRFSVYRCHPKKPVVIMTWPGANPILPAILLNSHMDVVPVSEVLIYMQMPSKNSENHDDK